MKIIAGQVARKKDFWDRKEELEDIWYKLKSGSNILLVAPRRVGKTSIMYNLIDTPKDNSIVLYIDTESADSVDEFWKKLFNKLLEEDFINTLQTKSKVLFEKFKSINIIEITTKGVKFSDGDELDYIKAFRKLLLDSDEKIILMIDEFAQTIENIIKYEDEKSARLLLKKHRELRHDEKLKNKIQFIYAGSIGLESVASKINSIATINDLAVVKVLPLKTTDAKKFIQTLSKANNIDLDDLGIGYILEKVEWLIPFYIQLILAELRRINKKIKVDDIDKAFVSILDNRNYFEHWHTRLKSLADDEYKFAKEILNILSEQSTLESNEIINLGVKYSLDEQNAKDVIHSLIYDGYINNNDNLKVYRYNSPILKMWWYKNVAN